MNPSGDTLDIKPLAPAGAGFGAPKAQANDEVEAARARIAGMPEGGQILQPGQSVSLRDQMPTIAQPLPQPVSPAAEVAASTPAILPTPIAASAKASVPGLKSPKAKRALPSPVRPILSAIGTFVFLLVIFKSQIILSQLKYLTSKPAAITSTATAVDSNAVIATTPTISIPKINVSAPVVFDPSIQEASILKSLEGGVVHYGTTVNPGQNGNMVIVGHSSNDWWEPGNYKFVFVLLDKLVVGDEFSIDYQSHRYVYKVTGTKVVQPTDLSVLAPSSGPTATLITCTPPGTSWKRLVIQADQVSPTPSQAATVADNSSASDQPIQLPGNAPAITNQISQAWHNIVRGISGIFGRSETTTPSTSPTPNNGATPTNSTTLPGA